MAGILSGFKDSATGILNSMFGADGAKGMDFLKSPEALGLAAGLLKQAAPTYGFEKAPSFSTGFGEGLENVIKIRAEQAKHGGLQGKFGKALSDYNSILNAYGPEHEYTKLAKQNLDNLAAGQQGISFEFDPVTGAYSLGMGGTAKGAGTKGGPVVAGEGVDKKVRTPPTPGTTTDVQKQIIAKKRAEIVNPQLEHPYVGSGSNLELANDILKYNKKPNPELREKLIKLATAEKLVSYSANLNLLAEGGSTGESATKRQEAAVRQGWAEGAHLALKNMPKDIIEEAKKRADAIKGQVSKASEKEYASGFAIDLPNDEGKIVEGEKIYPTPESVTFRTEKSARNYLNELGVEDKKIQEILNKGKYKSITQIADLVFEEQEGLKK